MHQTGSSNQVLARWTDAHDFSFGIPNLPFDQFLSCVRILAPYFGGVSNFNHIVPDRDKDRLLRRSLNHDAVVAGPFGLRRPESTEIGSAKAPGNWGLGRHLGSCCSWTRRASERADAEDEEILRIIGLDFRADVFIHYCGAYAARPQKPLNICSGWLNCSFTTR